MDLEAIFHPDINLYIVIGRFARLEVELVCTQFDAYMAIDIFPTSEELLDNLLTKQNMSLIY